ncbi:MAG: uncharacterized protein QOH05_4151 [Acetobacteraceae bacterium]|jgi:ApbE superfamily uncharacterized protein (UPF0280 family)|nr:uncharacterized protein [Acetobacteraceae bacterium]
MSAVAALLPDGRLHLQHGPIDCLCRAWGDQREVRAAYQQAARFFASVLDGLCAELPLLRAALPARRPDGAIAQAMHAACSPFADRFITPMAAVAGAVADAVLAAMVEGRDVPRAFVNNGGDIAFHLTPGTSLRCGLVADLTTIVPTYVTTGHAEGDGGGTDGTDRAGHADCVAVNVDGANRADGADRVMAGLGPATHDLRGQHQGKSWVTGPSPVMTRSAITNTNANAATTSSINTTNRTASLDATFLLAAEHPARGLATSGRACKGRGGRSFSFGIADSVSILARTAAQADAAATIVGNAVDLPGHPAIDRRPASEIDPASDLGDRLVTFNIGPLPGDAIETALDAGRTMADTLVLGRLIEGAVLTLRDRVRISHASLVPQEAI